MAVDKLLLDTSDLTKDDHGYDVLTESALDRLIRDIEAAHAHGIVRRRRMLVCSVQDAARAKQATSVPLKDWILDVNSLEGRTIVAIAPRLPTAGDLQRLVPRVIAGAITATGSKTRLPLLNEAGSVAPGAIYRLGVLRRVTGAVAPTGAALQVSLGRVFGKAGTVVMRAYAKATVRLRIRRPN